MEFKKAMIGIVSHEESKMRDGSPGTPLIVVKPKIVFENGKLRRLTAEELKSFFVGDDNTLPQLQIGFDWSRENRDSIQEELEEDFPEGMIVGFWTNDCSDLTVHNPYRRTKYSLSYRQFKSADDDGRRLITNFDKMGISFERKELHDPLTNSLEPIEIGNHYAYYSEQKQRESLIRALMRKADERFKQKNGCSCHNCSQEESCDGNCKKCCYRLYPHREDVGDRRDLDCQNLADCYVCYYSPKYASEILYAAKDIRRIIKDQKLTYYEKLRFLSFGCGPCTDLMAFDSMQKDGEEALYTDDNLSFHGVDLNEKEVWTRIYTDIEDYYNRRYDVVLPNRMKERDVLDYIETDDFFKFKPNIITIHYLLSEMHFAFSSESDVECVQFDNVPLVKTISDFVRKIARRIEEVYKADDDYSCFVIFNDSKSEASRSQTVDHSHVGRNYFKVFLDELGKTTCGYSVIKDGQFPDDRREVNGAFDSNELIIGEEYSRTAANYSYLGNGYNQKCSGAQLLVLIKHPDSDN